ncbi:MAG: MarR family transcriptional regulator [Promethearchaeota archaeon]|jgi:DNA-binding MarR family transcriptional regulator
MIGNGMYSIQDYSIHEKLLSLPPSSKFVLYLLKRVGPLTQKDIIKKTLLPKRTVVYSLKKLHEDNFVKKLTDCKDKRIRLYEILI